MELASRYYWDIPSPCKAGLLSVTTGRDGWKRRWCVLKNNVLYVYREATEPPLLVLLVDDCRADRGGSAGRPQFFRIISMLPLARSAHTIYEFAAESVEDSEAWVGLINKAGYDKVKERLRAAEDKLKEAALQLSENGSGVGSLSSSFASARSGSIHHGQQRHNSFT